jgi:hypothetical protein
VRKARVLIVGKPNEVLKAFFDDEATQAVAKVDFLKPDQVGTDAYLGPAMAGAYDLVIFDRCGPAKEEDMPRANTFFIGYPPPPWKPLGSDAKDGRTVEKVTNPHIKGWEGKSGVLRGLVALHEIGIAEAFKMNDLPDRTPKLMESDLNTLLLLSLNRHAFTDFVLTFPILNDKGEYNTNWPLAVSFPLFLRNVLYSLGNVSDAGSEENTQPGREKKLVPDAAVDEIAVVAPGGVRQTVKRGTRSEFSFTGTDWVGPYQVIWNDALQRSFAVNLFDGQESNPEPRAAVQLGAEEVQAGKVRSQPQEWWRWFVLAALVLLLLEWYIYNRRIYV